MLANLKASAVRHRKPLAVTGSVGLHLIIIWYLLQPSSNALSELDKRSYGEVTQAGMNIDLERQAPVPPMPAAPPKPPQTQALATFAAMSEPTTVATPSALSAPAPAKTLNEVFGKNVFAPSTVTPPKAETQHPSDQESHVKLSDTSNRTTPNDLWKAIEPCWRRVATKDTEGVTLTVSFSPLGNLAKPPVIERPNGAHLDDRRLKSESMAINALAQCGPYLMAFGQSNVSVQFPAGS